MKISLPTVLPAFGPCRGRHCQHDDPCFDPAPRPVVPNSRDLTYCTCPRVWNAVIPPPPRPVHGTITMPSITCLPVEVSTASAVRPGDYVYVTWSTA